MVALMWGTPGVARVFLASLTTLMNFAVETGVREDNPCTGIKRPKLSKEGRLTWSEEDIAAFEARHPVGSSARLALALLLHTGQRLSDVIKLGPSAPGRLHRASSAEDERSAHHTNPRRASKHHRRHAVRASNDPKPQNREVRRRPIISVKS